jgi:excisionase family DNA binding protein
MKNVFECTTNHRKRAMVMNKLNSTETQNGSFIDPRMLGLFKSAYSVKETLDQLSIGRTTFYELVARGDLKIVKLGKKSLVYASDIAALLVNLRAASEGIAHDDHKRRLRWTK